MLSSKATKFWKNRLYLSTGNRCHVGLNRGDGKRSFFLFLVISFSFVMRGCHVVKLGKLFFGRQKAVKPELVKKEIFFSFSLENI